MYIPEIGVEGNVNTETVLSLSESRLFVGLFFFNRFFLWLFWVFVAACELSLVVARVQGHMLLTVVASLVAEHGCRQARFQQLRHVQHVGSSRTRDPTRVPCIGRQIPNHWTTRRVPEDYKQLFVILLKSSSHPKIIL